MSEKQFKHKQMQASHEKSKSGCVILVGAGPGDAGLITVRGLEALRRANVVVYDALANPALLDEAPRSAERIDVGKRAKHHKMQQGDINILLVDKARAGNVVVRLKGGDPYLFGRGAEEAAFCGEHDVPVEVVPGITSGLAAPLTAGIPVTHRKLASTITLVTGHEDPTKDESSVDYRGLAALIVKGGTVCFYMGVGRLPLIAERLIQEGVDAEMPAAVVQWGTSPQQRMVCGALGQLADIAKREGIAAPAIIVVGPTAAMKDRGLDFFTARPLFAQRIVITRTRRQSSELRRKLEELGADVLEAPTIEIHPPANWEQVDDAIAHLHAFDWLVLTSVNGVEVLRQRLDAMHKDARVFAGLQVACIGDATARTLREQLGIRADLMPKRFVAEELAQAMIETGQVEGRRCLLLRADIARPALPQLLEQAGAQVREVTAYETRPAAQLPDAVVEALQQQTVDWITFTSSSTVTNFCKLSESLNVDQASMRTASIGPITSATLREQHLPVTVEAKVSNLDGLVEALVAACTPRDQMTLKAK